MAKKPTKADMERAIKEMCSDCAVYYTWEDDCMQCPLFDYAPGFVHKQIAQYEKEQAAKIPNNV